MVNIDKQIRLEEPRLAWNGGFSQDYFVGPENTYLYSKNIDVQTKLKMIRLSPSITTVTSHSGTCSVIFKDSHDTIWYLYDNGQIYNSAGFNTNPSGASSLVGVNCYEFFDSAQNKDFLVYVIAFPSTFQVYTIDLATNTVSAAIVTQTYTGVSAPVIPMGSFLSRNLMIGIGNNIYKFYNTIQAGQFSNPFTFPSYNNVTFISFFSQFAHIYTFNGVNNEGDTMLYLWNGSSFSLDYSFQFSGKKVYAGTTNKTDYLVTGTSSAVSMLESGANNDITPIFNSLEQDGRFDLIATNGGITNKNGITFIAGTCLDTNGIFVCGKLKPNYPFAVSFMYESPNGLPVDSICVVGQNIYFSAGGVIYRSIMFGYNHNTFATEGEIVSKYQYGGTLSRFKKNNAIYLGLELPNSGCEVDVYLAVDSNDITPTYQLVKTITTALTDINNHLRIKIYSNEIMKATPLFQDVYTQCLWKLVLRGNGTTTPTIREMINFYEVTDD